MPRHLESPGPDEPLPSEPNLPELPFPGPSGAWSARARSSPARAPRGARAWLDDATVVVAARTGVNPRAVLGLVLVATLVLSVLGVRVALARERATAVPIGPVAASGPSAGSSVGPGVPSGGRYPPASPGSGPTPAALTSAGPSGAPATTGAARLVVHVVGQVRRPGVVTLPAGSRVRDAVAAAGGATRRASLASINLARPLVDGEQVLVPRPGQSPGPPGAVPPGVSPPGVSPPAGSLPGGSGSATGAVVDLNTAGLTELDALSGIGPVLAQRILDWRTQHGRFTSVDELSEVSGIGDATLERLRPQVRV
jgi:competence protein ComEA